MTRLRLIALFVVVAAVAVGAGYLFNPWSRSGGAESGNIGPLMASSMPDLDGQPRALKQWQGKVVVINFWATWCPPCLEEIPEFVRMQEKLGGKGLQFIGIALDDPEKVRRFASKNRMNYPILLGDLAAIELSRVAGNKLGGLPFTLILDRSGGLIRTETGRLDEQKLTTIVAPLLLQ